MKKTLSSLISIFLLFSIIFAQDIEAEVDVIAEQPQIQNEEMLKIIETRVQRLKLSNEEKQKIMVKIRQKFEETDVSKLLLCVEICNEIEERASQMTNVDACIQAVERVENRIRERLRYAKQEIEKTQTQNTQQQKQAVEVLQELVEAGIPVEHALAVVKETLKETKQTNIKETAMLKIQKRLQAKRISVPLELKQQIMARITTQTQLRQETKADIKERLQNQQNKDRRQKGK